MGEPTPRQEPAHTDRRPIMRRWATIAAVVVCAFGALALGLWQLGRFLNSSPRTAGIYRLEIADGASARDVGRQLDREGIVRSSFFFRIAARFTGYDRNIHAGVHWVDGRATTVQILRQLGFGGLNIVRLTVPEGRTIDDIAEAAAKVLPFPADSFIAATSDTAVLRKYPYPGENSPATSMEGFLYPDTYFFDRSSTARDVIDVLARRFAHMFTDNMAARADTMGLTVLQVVALASIIEREAVVDSERAVISQVFHERLRIGIPLGADPTVKYALRKVNRQRPRRLSLADIEVVSPYNTYRNAGLPPGPICNPGIGSIRAALWPAKTNYLFFVSNWNGTHTFTRTLDEHIVARRKSNRQYRQLRAGSGR